MPRDATETKRRVLEAAYREFAAYGLAGARVDRIAANAEANKRAIYDYFGSKEELFDTVVVERLLTGMETVPETWDDLARFAGAVFDYYASDPDRARLTLWRQLERPEPTARELESFGAKLAEMRAARPTDEAIDTADLYALIWALHHTAILYPGALRPTAESDQARLRAAVVAAVGRLSAPWRGEAD
ncbi:TetR/AcrR family transcriptional regulator [Amycolatopsis sp. DSM 110486]|uniref:TetR/AcrR family transcriptional regulator n=1 Tax=Amycolatopsis sp. DSM 110486 TaxID=2865832 RepID=UPI001C69ABED|nr:TetR family transcriptional regulator [Amycolatopsis sp. DSM 110486]QYN21638.1 TetR family transcriptional regulator [Amycolatopsis sp. DSM 110486]